MGIATIMILCCHASFMWTSMPYLLKRILGLGNLGVDLFLFLSGVGLSYSFEKVHSINDLFRWYRKRYIRIFVPYAIIMLPLLLYYKISHEWSWSEYFLHFSTLDFWLHHQGAWYIAMLIPLYALTPSLIRFYRRLHYYVLTGIVMSLLFYVLSLLKISGDTSFIAIVHNIQGCCLRIPAFLMGLALYPSIRSSKEINPMYVMGVAIMISLLVLYIEPQFSFPFITLVPILILFFYILSSKIATTSVRRILVFIGAISLESYLTNVYLAEPCRKLFTILPTPICDIPTSMVYLFIVGIGLVISYYTNRISHIIIKNYLPVRK